MHCCQNVLNPLKLLPTKILGQKQFAKLEVEDLPVIVVIDSEGNNLYETAIKEYAKI